jgi:putative tricarboxylic transport membrane protein
MVCTIGSYYLKESLFDVLIMFVFGLLGLFLKKQNIDPIPLIMGFVIGVLLEEYLRKALILGDGDWLLFVNRPICFFILLLTCMIFGLKYFLNKTEK